MSDWVSAGVRSTLLLQQPPSGIDIGTHEDVRSHTGGPRRPEGDDDGRDDDQERPEVGRRSHARSSPEEEEHAHRAALLPSEHGSEDVLVHRSHQEIDTEAR